MGTSNSGSTFRKTAFASDKPSLVSVFYNTLFVAFKLLLRTGAAGRKRNIDYLLCIGAIALSVFSLILASSISGSFGRVIESGLLASFGHGTVRKFGGYALDEQEKAAAVLESNRDIKAFTPYCMQDAIVENRNRFECARSIGVDFNAYRQVVDFQKYLVQGDAVRDSTRSRRGRMFPTIVIGSGLARTLDVSAGDEVVLAALNQGGPRHYTPAMMRFTVADLFRIGLYELDNAACVIPLVQSLKLFDTPGPEGFWVRTVDHRKAADILETIKGELGGYPHAVSDYRKNNATLFRWLSFQNRISIVAVSLILVVAIGTCLTLLLTISLERWTELGVLRCLGASRRSLFMINITQGFLLGFLGTTAGVFLAMAGCRLINRFSLLQLPADVYIVNTIITVHSDGATVIFLSMLTIISTVLTSMVPAVLSLRITPVEVLKPNG